MSLIDQAKEQMAKTVENTKENFSGIRTGRANPALLNGITVDYYGAPTPIKAVASIGVPEPRTLSVTPFDASQAGAVEKALRNSDLGISPNRDGNVIRLTMPELTEDRRKEYVKLAKGKAEDGKVAVRNIRRKTKETIDKAVKDGEMGEDEGDRLLKDLDKVTKSVTDEIDTLLETKQKEIDGGLIQTRSGELWNATNNPMKRPRRRSTRSTRRPAATCRRPSPQARHWSSLLSRACCSASTSSCCW